MSNNYIPPIIKLSAHLANMGDIEGLELLQKCIEENVVGQNTDSEQLTSPHLDKITNDLQKIVDERLDKGI